MNNITPLEISKLNSIFIPAPRQLSTKRFTQLIKRYLPKANIVLGISSENYVLGFEGQPQFKMLKLSDIEAIIEKVDKSNSFHKIYTFEYSQSKLSHILKNINIRRVLLVNGSWKYTFHNSEAYQVLVNRNIDFKYISPFTDEIEAKEYEKIHQNKIQLPDENSHFKDLEMLALADKTATQSFDYSFQMGACLGLRTGSDYKFITTAFNQVIPYQTYALHHGNSREKNHSLIHDTNHYDTIHAEMQILIKALSGSINLDRTSLFVNLLPCPNCARTLSQTNIAEFVYLHDHSSAYAVDLLQKSGKIVRRLVI